MWRARALVSMDTFFQNNAHDPNGHLATRSMAWGCNMAGPKMAPVFRAANAALKIGAGRLMLHAMHAHKAFCACRRRKPPFRRLPLPPPSMPCPSASILKPNFFPKICGARLLISDLFGCALFCVQQNLWSFPQISGAQRFKSVRGLIYFVSLPPEKIGGFGW